MSEEIKRVTDEIVNYVENCIRYGNSTMAYQYVEHAILTQVDAERERCAKIAETSDLPIDIKYWMGTKKTLTKKVCREIATLIRNKPEKE